jgi:hypothetical protein
MVKQVNVATGNGTAVEDLASNGQISAADLPGPDDADIEDLARFAVTAGPIQVAGRSVTCTVGPPGKINFFRVHPDPSFHLTFTFYVHEEGSSKTHYLLLPQVCGLPEFQGSRRVLKQLSPYVTQHGALGLWPVAVSAGGNKWISSALVIIESAKANWVAAIPDTDRGEYIEYPAPVDLGKAQWPDLDRNGWLKLGFPKDRIIGSRDHPIAKKLRAE